MRNLLAALLTLALMPLWLAASVNPAEAEVVRQEGTSLVEGVPFPTYEWKDSKTPPKAIVLAAHGATLHGGAYDTFGQLLADHGYLVIAPDMHGFGHYYHDSTNEEDRRVIYDAGGADLVQMLGAVRKQFPGLPVILAGESTGAQLGVRLAAEHPDLLDGVILSSGSPHLCFPPIFQTAWDLTKCAFHPRRQVDLSPYITRLISEDPQIVKERLNDPLSRNKLSLTQCCKIYWMNRRTMDYAGSIPVNMPVLLLQGKEDRMFKPQDVNLLSGLIKSEDKTLQWFPNRGHILLETKYMKPDTAQVVLNWLDKHTQPESKKVAAESTVRGEVLGN